MSNEKLADLLRDCLSDYSHPNFTDRRGMADRIRAALRAHAAEAAQAQSGDWVVVPREPTEWMLQAAEDAVNAAAHCESTTDDLSAIAYKAALAAAPQPQAAEPVAFLDQEDLERMQREPMDYFPRVSKVQSLTTEIPLYTHPQQAQDAEVGESQHPIENAVDARRYRWLAEHPRNGIMNIDGHAQDVSHYGIACVHGMSLSDAIDAAMAREAGR